MAHEEAHGEVKEEQTNGLGSQYSSNYRRT